jgi:hypothetical protein
MAFEINFSCSQTVNCELFTLTDTSLNYEDIDPITRTLEITFSDASVRYIDFPFDAGAGDTIEIGIDKDYTMSIKMIVNETYDITIVYIATCNTDAYYRSLGAELDDKLDNGGCTDCILNRMERIDNYRNSAVSYASIDIVAISQEFLNRIPAVYSLTCTCS